MGTIQDWLAAKFEEILNRTRLVLMQLQDDEINWRPNEASNSIANLIAHMEGNIGERVGSGILHKPFQRQRDAEFDEMYSSRDELIARLEAAFGELIAAARGMSDEALQQTQTVRGKARTHLDVLLTCATHFSEHMGQILYIAKLMLGDTYTTTTIAKASRRPD